MLKFYFNFIRPNLVTRIFSLHLDKYMVPLILILSFNLILPDFLIASDLKKDFLSPTHSPKIHKPVNDFDSSRAFQFLEKQVNFGPRTPNSIGHKKTRLFITKTLKNLADIVQEDRFTKRISNKTYMLTNIFAIFEGNSKNILLLGAHWDTRPWADKDSNPSNHQKPILGANDGASGVAVLMELAHVLNKTKLPYTVILAFFDGEDLGTNSRPSDFLIGSKRFAANMGSLRPNEAIIIDMIGDKDLQINSELISINAAPDLWLRVLQAADEVGVKSFFKGPPIEIIDDHLPLIYQGVKAIDLIDFNYPYWHTLADTPDKCSPRSLEIVGKTILQFIFNGS